MANTPGGGALIVGADDAANLPGTKLDVEWLRNRIYGLTDRRLTAAISRVLVNEVRLLIIRCPEALEPIRFKNRIKWRVSDKCVEVDAATILEGRLVRLRADWSTDPSGYDPSDARPVALERARGYLIASGESQAVDLAGASDSDLLRRLNVVSRNGTLTNAGALAFVGTGENAIDYIRREVPGGDSTNRLRIRERHFSRNSMKLRERSLRQIRSSDLCNRKAFVGRRACLIAAAGF